MNENRIKSLRQLTQKALEKVPELNYERQKIAYFSP